MHIKILADPSGRAVLVSMTDIIQQLLLATPNPITSQWKNPAWREYFLMS